MRKGPDLIDLIGKLMLGVMAVLFGLSFVVGPILLFVGFGFFFIFPLLESGLTFYHSWLYRNIQVGKGFMDEEADTWEKFKWRIIKVIDFNKLPKMLHKLYMKNIDKNYKNILRDKNLDKINRKFLITWDGEAIPVESIPTHPTEKPPVKKLTLQETVKNKPEKQEKASNKDQTLSEDELREIYNTETSKNAEWQGKLTKGYLAWKKKFKAEREAENSEENQIEEVEI